LSLYNNVTYNTPLSNVNCLAIDAAGDIYASTSKAIEKMWPGTNSYPFEVASGFSYLTGIAVDAQQNIYVADQGNNVIQKIVATTGAVITLATGYGSLQGVAVDASGNVYFSDLNSTSITELPIGGGPPVKIGSGLKNATNIAMDAAGNIYVSDKAEGAVEVVYKNRGFTISPALPPGLSIDPATGIISGTPLEASAATSYTVTATNTSGASSTTVNIDQPA
jgi:sugar lactone lactonase YvrE